MNNILGVHLYQYSLSLVINECNIKCADIKSNYCISATGAHGIITAKKDYSFKNILNSFYINLPDGMPSVWIGRLKGAKEMERCYGPDFFKETMKATADKNIRHYFCGGQEGVAEELKESVGKKFNNFNIVGTYSPPFREMTDDEMNKLAEAINSKGTNIVWIGLSTPKQEKFAYKLSKFAKVNFICTVGAAFDFHTGKVKQAPAILQKMGLEWFFRLLMEPKRLWKRYFEIVPLFIWYNFLEFIKGDFFNYKNGEQRNV